MEYKIKCNQCKKEFLLVIQPQVFNRTSRHFCSNKCFHIFLSDRMKKDNPMKNKEVSNKQSNSLINTYKETDLRKKISLAVKRTFDNGRINWNKGKYLSSLDEIEQYCKLVRSNLWKILRKEILERDKYICQECKKYGNHVDHIIPWRISKDNSKENLQCLCNSCNSKKRSRDEKKYK